VFFVFIRRVLPTHAALPACFSNRTFGTDRRPLRENLVAKLDIVGESVFAGGMM